MLAQTQSASKSTLRLLLMCAAVLSSAAPLARAAQSSHRTVIDTISGQDLLEIMRDEGYSVDVTDDGDVSWKLDGYKCQVFVASNKRSIQFHIAFSDSNATLKKVNEWNKSKKFSRTYLDDKGDPHLELDLELDGGVTVARVTDFLKTSRASLTKWLDEVVR